MSIFKSGRSPERLGVAAGNRNQKASAPLPELTLPLPPSRNTVFGIEVYKQRNKPGCLQACGHKFHGGPIPAAVTNK